MYWYAFFLKGVSIQKEGKMKFKTFQLLLLFFVTTFVFFAFSKGAFSQDIETPSN